MKITKVQAELEAYNEENFIPVSQKLGELLYGVMNKNIDIPPADLLVVEYGGGTAAFSGPVKDEL